MAKDTHPLSDGVRMLKAWIPAHGFTATSFAEQKGIDRIALYRVLNGERKRISIDFAAAVERATDGEVDALTFQRAPSPVPSRIRRPRRAVGA